MPLQKLPFKPGVYKDDSPLAAKGFWVDADKIRFVRGMPETIYGWEIASPTTLLGICRGALTYADNSRNPFAAFGTHLRLYAMDVDGNVTDITPVIARATEVTLTIQTFLGQSTAQGGFTAHGLVQDQKFSFDDSTTATVGGITVNGTYVVANVPDANTVQFGAAQTATSNAGPTNCTVNVTVFLAPGQVDGLGGFGYGTGGYGDGGYSGSASALTYYPRTWSLAAWGQNLLANPRGGGIYEWAPYVGATELTTNGTFTGGTTGWTLGSGWAYGTNNVVATNASTSLSQIVTVPAATWCLAGFDVSSWSTGYVQIEYNSVAIGGAVNANGSWRTAFFTSGGGAATLQLIGTNLGATLDNVSITDLASATLLPNAPAVCTGMFVTAERIVVAYGVNNDLVTKFDGSFSAMRVAWSDQGANQTWTPTTSNLAGSWTLTGGSRIIRGLPANQVNYLHTDTAIHVMQYVPDPSVVYSFTQIATGCGLIGPNAAAVVGGIDYWMDNAGGFWMFDGSYPAMLRCTMARDVLDNLAWVQQDKIYAFQVTNAGRVEVWWLLPDERDGQECSRYVSYEITSSLEAGFPVWSCGMFTRTAWTPQGIYEFPLAVDTAGTIWFHEKGFTQNGGARSWFATSSYVDQNDGAAQMRLLGMVPDQESLQGNYSLTVNARIHNNQGVLQRQFGPYGVTAASGNVSFRANGQELQFEFSGDSAPAFWRMGATRFNIEQSARVK